MRRINNLITIEVKCVSKKETRKMEKRPEPLDMLCGTQYMRNTNCRGPGDHGSSAGMTKTKLTDTLAWQS